MIVVNKIDRLKHGHVATQMKEAARLGDFHALHPVSALTGDGIDDLRGDLISLLPEGPMYFPAGTDTDMPLEARIAELVREQALDPDEGGGAARRHRRGGRARRQARARARCTPRPRARSRS